MSPDAATSLTATSGAISQTSGIITAGTLNASAGTGVTLNDANAVSNLGTVGNSPFTATTGFSFADTAGFSAGGISGGTAVNLTLLRLAIWP